MASRSEGSATRVLAAAAASSSSSSSRKRAKISVGSVKSSGAKATSAKEHPKPSSGESANGVDDDDTAMKVVGDHDHGGALDVSIDEGSSFVSDGTADISVD